MGAYVVAGALTSALVGAALGLAGQLALPDRMGPGGLAVALAVAAYAIARELRWPSLPLPQLARQTQELWAKTRSSPVAAALWGLHVGLTVTTWFTFAGVWLLVVVAVLFADPAFGAAVFAAFWAGRTLSVWIAPLLVADVAHTPELLDAVDDRRRAFQLTHVVGLLAAAAALTAHVIQSGTV
ncbi:MAG TPA: hypothetical protein VGW75_08650 [Solirubrobacteraceae bacterium]|nr:hypothetical protein [Solirubrobacteraceae bacterium]